MTGRRAISVLVLFLGGDLLFFRTVFLEEMHQDLAAGNF